MIGFAVAMDPAVSETDNINDDIRKMLDVATREWGVEVTRAELKDIQLPDGMRRAMAQRRLNERTARKYCRRE